MARLLLGPATDIYLTIEEAANFLGKTQEEIKASLDLYQINGKGDYYVSLAETSRDTNSAKAKQIIDYVYEAIGDIQIIADSLQAIGTDIGSLLRKEHLEIVDKEKKSKRRRRTKSKV